MATSVALIDVAAELGSSAHLDGRSDKRDEPQPLRERAALAPGDEVAVPLSLTSKRPMQSVHLRDPRGDGFEPWINGSQGKYDLRLRC